MTTKNYFIFSITVAKKKTFLIYTQNLLQNLNNLLNNFYFVGKEGRNVWSIPSKHHNDFLINIQKVVFP